MFFSFTDPVKAAFRTVFTDPIGWVMELSKRRRQEDLLSLL